MRPRYLTAQSPHKIENRHPTIDFGDMYLYLVVRATSLGYDDYDGKPVQFALPLERPPHQPTCSSLWNGYIDRFILNADGTLDHIGYAFLVGFNDDASDRYKLQDGAERVTGDFYLEFRHNFYGDHVYVPFRDGVIVANRDEWITVRSPCS